MDMTTRDTVSVVGTTIHEDFFEPRPCHSQGHSNPDLSHRTTSHLAVDGTKNHTKSEKKSPCLGISSTKSCRYTKPPVQTFITFSLLHPKLACSGGRGGWKYLKHFAWRRERSQWSLVFGLDISNLFARLFIYVFYFH
ncbi:hypothetical protein V8E51_002985 [Hyaloscypha variabilis]